MAPRTCRSYLQETFDPPGLVIDSEAARYRHVSGSADRQARPPGRPSSLTAPQPMAPVDTAATLAISRSSRGTTSAYTQDGGGSRRRSTTALTRRLSTTSRPQPTSLERFRATPLNPPRGRCISRRALTSARPLRGDRRRPYDLRHGHGGLVTPLDAAMETHLQPHPGWHAQLHHGERA